MLAGEEKPHELLSVVTTADGSKTLYSPRYQQTYHSRHGALTESRHVFIDASGLAELVRDSHGVSILEIGFGTGLNYFLAAELALQSGTALHYTALEQHILPVDTLLQLEYRSLLDAPDHYDSVLSHLDELQRKESFVSHKIHFKNISLQLFSQVNYLVEKSTGQCNIVFLDAFSPEQNPELWSKEMFAWMYNRMSSDARLVTYCVKGRVRRELEKSGLRVQKLPGPPGKREMLLATK